MKTSYEFRDGGVGEKQNLGVGEVATRKKIVDYKWVYTVKYIVHGSIERYKARLVAKSYTQTNRIDYLEALASVAKMNTVSVLLSLAANFGWNCNSLIRRMHFHTEN